MRGPDETTSDVVSRYARLWREWLGAAPTAPIRFSLSPPRASVISASQDDVDHWLVQWRRWIAAHPEAQLSSVTLKTAFGRQTVFTHLEFSDIDALSAVTAQTRDHWARAQSRYGRLRSVGIPSADFRPILPAIVSLPEPDFDLLLRAVAWFWKYPRSGLSMRQVPVIGMHTKWLASHRRLVWGLLGKPEPVRAEEHSDDALAPEELDQLGLKVWPPHIDLVLADPVDRTRVGGLHHLSAPPAAVAALPLAPSRVLIVENKESALPIADSPGLVIIHSLGNRLGVLRDLPWLPRTVFYWGDLDRAGFTLLSRARTIVPGLVSVLMDEQTYGAYDHLAVEDRTKADRPDQTLTADESRALQRLTGETVSFRLEQERLPWSAAKEALGRALGEPSA